MKYLTFNGAEILAGLANMLECMGHSTDDRAIALGLEAPFLVLHQDGHYRAGLRLHEPEWLNLYLHPRGFHMEKMTLPVDEVPAALRRLPTAMLTLSPGTEKKARVVHIGYTDGRFHFVNVKRTSSPAPDAFSLTSAMLKRRLVGDVMLYTIKKCPAEQVDFIPLLCNSLEVLKAYYVDLMAVRNRTVTRDELHMLHEPLFRALMQDLPPLVALTEDERLAEELRYLRHDYRHVFTCNSPNAVLLSEHLPKRSLHQCLTWLHEDIVDRLYALGADDELMESRLSLFR